MEAKGDFERKTWNFPRSGDCSQGLPVFSLLEFLKLDPALKTNIHLLTAEKESERETKKRET